MGETEKKQRKQASNCKLWRVLCPVKEREGVCSMFWMVRDGLSEEVTFHFRPEEDWYVGMLMNWLWEERRWSPGWPPGFWLKLLWFCFV